MPADAMNFRPSPTENFSMVSGRYAGLLGLLRSATLLRKESSLQHSDCSLIVVQHASP